MKRHADEKVVNSQRQVFEFPSRYLRH